MVDQDLEPTTQVLQLLCEINLLLQVQHYSLQMEVLGFLLDLSLVVEVVMEHKTPEVVAVALVMLDIIKRIIVVDVVVPVSLSSLTQPDKYLKT